MSSILRALKKLEGKTPQEDDDHSLIQKIDTKKAINQRMKGAWLLNRILSVTLVVLILGIGGRFIFYHQSDLAKLISSDSSPPEFPKKASMKSPPPVEKRQTEIPKPAVRMKAIPTKPEDLPLKTPSSSILTPKKISAPIMVKKLKPSKRKSKEHVILRKPAQPEGMDVSGYKLEAIVWSNNPDSRFAVINGNIVRSGGSIDDGISVIHIGRNYVAVRSGEAEGKIRFKLEEPSK